MRGPAWSATEDSNWFGWSPPKDAERTSRLNSAAQFCNELAWRGHRRATIWSVFYLYVCAHWDWTERHQIKQWCYCPLAVCIDCWLYYHKVVTSCAPFLPRDGRNHLRYSLRLPPEGWPGWVGLLSGLDKYRDGRPAKGRHQSQY